MKNLLFLTTIIFFSCGKTIKDPAGKAITRFNNKLTNEVGIKMYSYGKLVYDQKIPSGQQIEIVDDGLDGAKPRLFGYDSIVINQGIKSKTDIKCSIYTDLATRTNCQLDTISLFIEKLYLIDDKNVNEPVYLYNIDNKDSTEMK